ERPAALWAAIAPDPCTAPTDVLFVDGVRRIEARTWIEGGVEPVPGGFASWAAGIVRCDGREELVDAEVWWGVVGPTPALGDVHTTCGRFLAAATADARPETLNTAINT